MHQVPPSMGFPMQAYWHGLPFPSPGELPNLGIKPTSPALTTMEALSVNFINNKYTLCFWPEQMLLYYSSLNIISIFPTSWSPFFIFSFIGSSLERIVTSCSKKDRASERKENPHYSMAIPWPSLPTASTYHIIFQTHPQNLCDNWSWKRNLLWEMLAVLSPVWDIVQNIGIW